MALLNVEEGVPLRSLCVSKIITFLRQKTVQWRKCDDVHLSVCFSALQTSFVRLSLLSGLCILSVHQL